MAQKRIATGAVNPLQRMLGTRLRLERTRLGLSSKEVADKLQLTDTYVRLVESGRATLNQSLAFKVIEVFDNANDANGGAGGGISFPRLALFLVGIHWVGAEMVRQNAFDADKRATKVLASLDTDFELFLTRTEGYFELVEGSDAQREFLEKVAAPEVGMFLRSDSYGRSDIEAIRNKVLDLQKDLLDLPTLNIDILLGLKRALSGRSFVHGDDIAARWETERASQFRRVRGLFLSDQLIVRQTNLDCFYYEFLSEKRFSTLQFIFINADLGSATLKSTFVTLLNAGRKKADRALKLEPLTEEEERKIQFCTLTDVQQAAYKETLSSLRRRDHADHGIVYDAYWSFETHYDLNIAFVGWHGNQNPDSTRNLTLEWSVRKANTFSKLWDEISDKADS